MDNPIEERNQKEKQGNRDADWNWGEDSCPLSHSAPPSFGAKEIKQKNKLSHGVVRHSSAANMR